jgi:hypothetical protein
MARQIWIVRMNMRINKRMNVNMNMNMRMRMKMKKTKKFWFVANVRWKELKETEWVKLDLIRECWCNFVWFLDSLILWFFHRCFVRLSGYLVIWLFGYLIIWSIDMSNNNNHKCSVCETKVSSKHSRTHNCRQSYSETYLEIATLEIAIL